MKTKPMRWYLEITYQGPPIESSSRFKPPIVPRPQVAIHDFKLMTDLEAWKLKHVPYLDNPQLLEEGHSRFTYRVYQR